MKHSKKKSSLLLPAMLSAGVCAVSLGGIVTSIPTVAYANSVDTQSTPSVISNDNHEATHGELQSNHAAASSKNQKANTPNNATRAASTDPAPAHADDNSVTWTRDDFNISADGKTVGGRKDVHYPETGQTVNEYVDGLTAKGKEKLKKNHHLVIPEGIEVIHECAFTGRANKVGNHHEHVDGETYIESVTLPQSLRIIEYGAFGWNKIKGTVTIPKNVISIHNGAFIANEIEKVVFEGVLDGKGKEHDTDADPYYLAGIGTVAFQGNKISEIVVKGNLGQYQLYPSNDPQKNDSVFDNQDLGTITISVGEEYKQPITFTQSSGKHLIYTVGGFKENGKPVQIENSSYFTKSTAGKYVATKPGTLQGQCIYYDFVNNAPRIIATSQFTYKIVPKPKIYTVTFVNEANQNYAKVQVQEGKSINDKSVLNQVMPNNPSKVGYTFRGWSTDKTGIDKTKEFSASTSVTGDITVYAIYTLTPAVLNAAPSLIVQDKAITEGDPLDLRSLIVSATDPEDGDLKDKVVIADQGGFTNTKPGSYKIVFQVTDKGKACVSKTATVTVNKKPMPWVKLNQVPSLIVQDKTITEGDPLDLRSLIVSATDPEDGDLKDKVVIADQGGYSNTKPGSYKIVFQVTDKGNACVSKTATVTVNKKPVPVPVPPAPQPSPQPQSQPQLSKTPQHVLPKTGDVNALGMVAAVLGASCAILGTLGKKLVQKRK